MARRWQNHRGLPDRADLESRVFATFGELAKHLRDEKGLNRAQLAKEFGQQKGYGAYIAKIENGEQCASFAIAKKYQAYFRLNVDMVAHIYANDVKLKLKQYLEGLCVTRRSTNNISRINY